MNYAKWIKWTFVLAINLFIFLALFVLAMSLIFPNKKSTTFQQSSFKKITIYNQEEINKIFGDFFKRHPLPPDKINEIEDKAWEKSNGFEKPYTTKDTPKDYREKVYQGNYSFQMKAFNGPLLIYDVLYNFDQFGRRKMPYREKTSQGVLLFGCSITLGEGVADDETFAYKLFQFLPESYNVYNFGYHGFAPNFVLDRANKYQNYFAGLSEDKAIFVWTFIPDHLKRFIGPLSSYNEDSSWIHYGSEFRKNSNSQFVDNGRFKDRKDPISIFLQFLDLTGANKLFNWPERDYTKEEIEEFAEAIDQVAIRTGRQLTQKIFFVFNRGDERLHKILDEKLTSLGFTVLYNEQYEDLYKNKLTYIPGDNHPNAVGHHIMAAILAQKILNKDFK